MQVGDEVAYIPDLCHSLQAAPDGSYPFVFGRKVSNRLAPPRRVGPASGKGGEPVVEELDNRETKEFIVALRKSPNATQLREQLVVLRPNGYWLAVVRGLHEGNMADLDIQSSNPGVTLHCDKVQLDPTGQLPHSYHEITSLTQLEKE